MTTALVFGSTGQDGPYLCNELIKNGYDIVAVRRSSSVNNLQNFQLLQKVMNNSALIEAITFEHADVTDVHSVVRLVEKYKPFAIFNLAAQSHVGISFETPSYTASVDALGALNIIEAIRAISPNTRYYQASTSELYGGVSKDALSESSDFRPRSPYSAAKQYAYEITRIYREAYKIHASNGILFNHESPLRGHHFVTQKVVRGLVDIKRTRTGCLRIGNLDAVRDWGHAQDYVRAMRLIVEADKPDDYVVATGTTHSVRQLIEKVCVQLGWTDLHWRGSGSDERLVAPSRAETQVLVEIDPKYFRPLEVDHLLGNPDKIKRVLGWTPKCSFDELLKEMVAWASND